jgi:hypothetical protein
MASSRLRSSAANACPSERSQVPRKSTSMADQCRNSAAIRPSDSGSADSMFSRVSWENTTPKPNVSSARFRS